ncbi:hypothetical protein ACFLS0_03605 [Candidatus Bipolaricaulota bacterium]
MAGVPGLNARLDWLREAFAKDGFEVVQAAFPDGRCPHLGLLAKHRTARNRGAARKRAYYVEGSPWEMGYLMGRLAEPRIHEMSEDYIENFIRTMLPWVRKSKRSPRDWPLYTWLVKRVNDLVPPGVPPHSALSPRIEEIRGMVAGCISANPRTEVTEKRLWALNAGVDCLFSLFYQHGLLELLFGKKVERIENAIACNSLAILNDAAEDGALFARDFMFPSCGIFQDAASLVMYNPLPKVPDGMLPMVSVTAPGIVGSIAAMNTSGVAAGVNVARAAINDPGHLGANSLLLVRHAIESAPTIEGAVECIFDAPRGVSWLYPMAADGGDRRDRACVVEAGATPRDESGKPTAILPFVDIPRVELKEDMALPSDQYLRNHRSSAAEYRSGAMVRWEDYDDPCGERGYHAFNERLWKRRLRSRLAWGEVKDQFDREGRIVGRSTQRRCPSGSYFAPLRGEPGNIVLSSNHYICPEMRLCAMDKWIDALEAKHADDSQWRYDTLNHLVQQTRWVNEKDGARRSAPKRLTFNDVKHLISFLEPECAIGDCPYAVKTQCYHYRRYENPACKKAKRPIAIEGAVSVFNLKRRVIESYFGYYGDEWVKLRLLNYVGDPRGGG